MYSVEVISSQDWIKNSSELAHLDVFGEYRPSSIEKIDFALISFHENKPTGYIQCIEMDSETLYWQLGGAFEGTNKFQIVPCYMALLEWSLSKYQRVTTRIENKNIKMLHLAHKMGFFVQGTWNFKNKIYLELLNEG